MTRHTAAAPPPDAYRGGAPETIPVFTLLPPRLLLLDIAGPIEILRRANLLQRRIEFDVRYVAPRAGVRTSIGLPLAAVSRLPAILPPNAWIILPGEVDTPLPGRRRPPPDGAAERADEARLIDWLRHAVRAEHTLISVCTGAFYAAAAGLFDGYRCTTHHTSAAELARIAPGARVETDRLFVEDRGRYSSAGVAAGMDLMLHILSRRLDTACALAVARYLIVPSCREGTDPQLSPWLDGRRHSHPAVHRVQDLIAADLRRSWRQAELARVAGASSRHLARLFQVHTGMSIGEYATRLRVALARQLVRETRLDMERVSERCGFGSSRQLHRAWRRYMAISPGALRRREAGPAN